MFSNRLFQVALFISIVTHSAVFFQATGLSIIPVQKSERKMEVRYSKILPEVRQPLKAQSKGREGFLQIPSKVTLNRSFPPPFADKDKIFKDKIMLANQNRDFLKPSFSKPDIIAVKKKITLPPIDIEKMNNPSYISYYQILREKIKRAAYQNCTREEVGQVYISFSISNFGILKEARLVEEKSSPNPYLRETALRSIKDASPFPNFPRELDYSSLTFNVLISFEADN